MRNRGGKVVVAMAVLFVLIVGLVIGCSRKFHKSASPDPNSARQSSRKQKTKTTVQSTRTLRHSADSGGSITSCVTVPVAQSGRSTAYPQATFEIESRDFSSGEASSMESPQTVTPDVRMTVSVTSNERKPDPGYQFFRKRAGDRDHNPLLRFQHVPQTGE